MKKSPPAWDNHSALAPVSGADRALEGVSQWEGKNTAPQPGSEGRKRRRETCSLVHAVPTTPRGQARPAGSPKGPRVQGWMERLTWTSQGTYT